MKVGIVGAGADKFTENQKEIAKSIIRDILTSYKEPIVLVSGHSPIGGIDIWAEEIAKELGIPMDIKTPKTHSWHGDYGYKERNLDIARSSDIVHVIVVKQYPEYYTGIRFDSCYHCNSRDHIKSGGCWTANRALKMGKFANWWYVP